MKLEYYKCSYCKKTNHNKRTCKKYRMLLDKYNEILKRKGE